MQFGFSLMGDEACASSKALSADPYMHVGIQAQILYPLRGWIFGDQEEPPAKMSEPDLDLARLTTLTATCGQIEILLVLEAIVL